jgi:2-phospho-L-lactate guanylyltransferase
VSGELWTIIVPVKALTHAKSRMGGTSPSPSALASAFLTDVLASVTASTSVREVVVATGDTDVSALARACGANVVDDTGHEGINTAVTAAAGHRGTSTAIAVVVSDLPRLTTSALDRALSAGEQHQTSFVADLAGTGTTIWLAESRAWMPPAFGVGSRERHRVAGSVDLVATLDADFAAAVLAARCDVDTPADLMHAGLPPLGQHTRALLDAGGSNPGA